MRKLRVLGKEDAVGILSENAKMAHGEDGEGIGNADHKNPSRAASGEPNVERTFKGTKFAGTVSRGEWLKAI